MHSLTYVFDAYCGWCYGLAPALRELDSDRDVQIQVIHGSLFSGANSLPISAFAHIPGANKRISALTGVTFGPRYEDLLMEGQFVLDSDAAARGFSALKNLAGPGRDLEMAHAMQSAFYQDGLSLSSLDTYIAIARSRGLASHRVRDILIADDTARSARAEQQRAVELGIQSYPTLLASTPAGPVKFGSPVSSAGHLRQQLEALERATNPAPERDSV